MRLGHSPQRILSPTGRQAYDKIEEGKVVREPKRSVGDVLMEHRDEEAIRSE